MAARDGEISDDDLVARAAGGDRSAWATLVDRHLPPLVSLAWYRLGNRAEAEDVAQDAMLRLLAKVPNWQTGGAALSTWLYRVTVNLCIDRLRARRPEAPLAEETGEAVVDLRPHVDRRIDTERAVRAAIAALPERQQTVLILVHYLGLTMREAAAVLALSERAAESLLARARRSLKRRLLPNREDLLGVG